MINGFVSQNLYIFYSQLHFSALVCIETSWRTNDASQMVTFLIGFGCRKGDCVALEMIVDCAKQLNLFSHFEGAEGGSW